MLKEQLVKLRKKHKKTQEDIAKILGITRPAYTAYESGNRQPDYDSLIKLAQYYDVSLDHLLTGKEKVENKNENLFFFDMEGLTAEEIEDIKRHIEYVKWKAQQERGKNNG
ncbi:helix-turn-helix transcriptional regulator [Cytobacillus solani]|uniref:helix-turn-helix domain-containing protein n=1 Tax=Cytobacillus solani TaxID=1637975 RepID=UPI002079212D|nr:helix-turn-helix transcriptional regulator [Cytobacillus solani]USK56354.1 helix-turn-helix transcriptional regulator [Cytobacillus solani]